jgi:flavin reductase (DIM6/NTAB) family NADH-FMN oxidoreductase RutF
MNSSHTVPPTMLDAPLELNPADWTKAQVYDLMTALVIPRPVAWVSTVSASGHRNLAPHSYFNLVADCPPHLAFSSIGVKDTLRNIRASGEFVVNIAGHSLIPYIHKTAEELTPEEDEFSFAGVTPVEAHRVRAPRVAEAKAHFECLLSQIVPVANGNVVIGRVIHVHVSPCIWKNGRVDPALLDPVVRLSRRYGAISSTFSPEEEPSAHVLK